jgi:hypothetical protein
MVQLASTLGPVPLPAFQQDLFAFPCQLDVSAEGISLRHQINVGANRCREIMVKINGTAS